MQTFRDISRSASIAPVRVVRVGLHPARHNVITSGSGTIHPLILEEFDLIDEVPLYIKPLSSPREVRGELEE